MNSMKYMSTRMRSYELYYHLIAELDQKIANDHAVDQL